MEKVSGHTNLFRRGAVYYFRARVPLDIVESYEKTEEKFSLKTKDYKEAVTKVRLEAVRVEKLFATHRLKMKRLSQPALTELTPEQLKHIHDVYYAYLLEEDDETRLLGFYDNEDDTLPDEPAYSFEEYADLSDFSSEYTRHNYARGKSDVFFKGEAQEVLQWDNVALNVDPSSIAFKQVIRALQEATIRAQESIQERNAGKPISTPASPKGGLRDSPVASGDYPLLSEAIEEWIEDKTRTGDWTVKTRESHALWSGAFLNALGDKPVDQYTKAEARLFRAALLKLPPRWTEVEALKGMTLVDAGNRAEELELNPMSLSSSSKVLGFVSSLWSWLINHYDLPSNIFQGIKIKAKRDFRNERDPFSIEELNAIFSSPLYAGCLAKNRPFDKGDYIAKDNAKYWSPLIALFTGMRINEILQLHTSDIKEEGGIHYFDIREGEGKKTKTEGSNRIPIHQTLVDAGFLQFVAKQSNSRRLFPELKPDKHGAYGGYVSPFFSTLLERIGIKHDKNSFHSFRHTFEDACRNNGIPKAVMDALQGHTERGMSGTYGSGYSLEVLNEEIQKVDYSGLEFSFLGCAKS